MAPYRLRTSSADRSCGAYSYVQKPATLRGAERPVSGTVAKEVDGRDERRSAPRPNHRMAERRVALADAFTRALAARRYTDALAMVQKLVLLDPCEPRWHQKNGEVLRTLGRNAEAAAAYRRAARRYEALTLHARASAAHRVANSLDGARSEAVTVSLTTSSTDRQRQRSLPDAAPVASCPDSMSSLAQEDACVAPPAEQSFAGVTNEAAADEQSFAGLLDEEA